MTHAQQHTSETDQASTLGEPGVEWAVEVTWVDWKKAGAKGPTSQYGPFITEAARDAFLDRQRRDRDIAATRVVTRLAAYSEWTGPTEAVPTSDEEREMLLQREYERVLGIMQGRAIDTEG